MSSVVERWALSSAIALAGCASAEPTSEAEVEATPTPTRLWLDLPAGVQVELDGEAKGTTPLPPLEVTPGAHRVGLRTTCHTLELAEVSVSEGTTTTLDQGATPTIGVATYVPKARSLDGTPLDVTMSIGSTEIGEVKHGQSVQVPACPSRLKLAHAGLGGFIEDVELTNGQTLVRDVVLAPGADMVRIHGGDFVMGISESLRHRLLTDEVYAEHTYPSGNQDGTYELPDLTRTPMRIATFDLDRHEVTAEQMVACRDAAKKRICHGAPVKPNGPTSEELCASYGGCPTRAWESSASDEYEEPYCTVKPDGGKEFRLVLRSEKDRKRPANCLERWEMEDYCRWVGKRLPTDSEWEYAARSRKTEYDQPWGKTSEIDGLRAGWVDKQRVDADPFCSWPASHTEQGVCDMMGNVNEHTVRTRPMPPDRPFTAYFLRGYSKSLDVPWRRARWPWDEAESITTWESGRKALTGFRCARDVTQE